VAARAGRAVSELQSGYFRGADAPWRGEKVENMMYRVETGESSIEASKDETWTRSCLLAVENYLPVLA